MLVNRATDSTGIDQQINEPIDLVVTHALATTLCLNLVEIVRPNEPDNLKNTFPPQKKVYCSCRCSQSSQNAPPSCSTGLLVCFVVYFSIEELSFLSPERFLRQASNHLGVQERVLRRGQRQVVAELSGSFLLRCSSRQGERDSFFRNAGDFI